MGKPQFAAVPTRAIGDAELTDGDLRVLAAVAAFDRLSHATGKGQGAWASHNTMSAWIGRNYSNFSTTMNKLLRLGYLVREPRATDRRQFTYRVVYTDADRVPSAKDVCPTANDTGEIVCPTEGEAPEIVCPEGSANPQETADSLSEYIPQRVGRDSVETEEINSTEVADVCTSASSLGINLSANRGEAGRKRSGEAGLGRDWSFAAQLPRNFARLPVGAQVARIEDAFASIGRNPDRLDSRERETFCTWLTEVAEAHWDEPHGQQANRLIEEMAAW